ncbi:MULTISPECIES: hypothetical protein [Streptomyces]|uniref:hypothetical protein n=1 Tax=Streptomyces TaxID=1883 RepID=UPI0009C12B1B|nr:MULTISPECIES: hypothetical protein [Streptomyces]
MRLQTCRRHPNAGPFMNTCSGCAQELYDIEQRNRAIAAASKALATIGAPADAQILDATWVRGALVVATRQPSSIAAEFAVDTFRLPTPDETDPDQTDPYKPGQWILIDQYGDHTEDAVPSMVGEATAYVRSLRPLRALAA